MEAGSMGFNQALAQKAYQDMQIRADFYAAFRAFSGQEDLSAKRRHGLHTINLAERLIEATAKTTPAASLPPVTQAAQFILATFAAAGEQHTSFWGKRGRAAKTYDSLRRLQADTLLTVDQNVDARRFLTRPETTAWVKLVNDQLAQR